jgi:uncharacterized protein DUF6582
MSDLKEKQRKSMNKDVFAYVDENGEGHLPLNDESHVRNAIARFNQVEGVSDDERDAAWRRITKAADKHGVEVNEKNWRELGKS